MCPRCDVTLTLHRDGDVADRSRCHHCGHGEPSRQRAPTAAPPLSRSTAPARNGRRPSCARRSRRCRSSGSTATPLVARAASRSAARASAWRSSGVLVGTQMVAQGHDFPEVSLAVVQDADATLRFPTSAPRSARSRSWRSSPGAAAAGRRGAVLVQTMCPRGRLPSPCRRRTTPRASWREELERRRCARLPALRRPRPDRRAPQDQAAEDAGESAAASASAGGAAFELLGPARSFRLKDHSRSHGC